MRSGRQSIEKIKDMMDLYPKAEVIFMVGEEACPYEFALQLAGIGSISHDYYIISDKYGLDEERIYLASEQEVMDIVEDWALEEGITGSPFEKIKREIESMWVECIVVDITTP